MAGAPIIGNDRLIGRPFPQRLEGRRPTPTDAQSGFARQRRRLALSRLAALALAGTPLSQSAVGRREATAAVGAEVDDERQHDEEPLESGHVMTRAPGPERGVRQRCPRQQEEPEQGQDPAAERMAEDIAEDPQQEQDQPRGDQGQQGERQGTCPLSRPRRRRSSPKAGDARLPGNWNDRADQLSDRQETGIS